jgi:hypothetical protein
MMSASRSLSGLEVSTKRQARAKSSYVTGNFTSLMIALRPL